MSHCNPVAASGPATTRSCPACCGDRGLGLGLYPGDLGLDSRRDAAQEIGRSYRPCEFYAVEDYRRRRRRHVLCSALLEDYLGQKRCCGGWVFGVPQAVGSVTGCRHGGDGVPSLRRTSFAAESA